MDSWTIHSFIESLNAAIESRDSYTAGHSDRVARLSGRIAKEMGYDDKKTELIHILGHMHDIGKLAIPDGILLKNGKYTKEEFEIMKQHPVVGYHIIKRVNELEDYAKIILYHHERIDGKGYPEGIAGSFIPIESCIISVADVFDAITSNRSYRSPVDVNKAINIILESKNTQLNEEAVNAFLKVEKGFLEKLSEEALNDKKSYDYETDRFIKKHIY